MATVQSAHQLRRRKTEVLLPNLQFPPSASTQVSAFILPLVRGIDKLWLTDQQFSG